jgi:hypothetical protein
MVFWSGGLLTVGDARPCSQDSTVIEACRTYLAKPSGSVSSPLL